MESKDDVRKGVKFVIEEAGERHEGDIPVESIYVPDPEDEEEITAPEYQNTVIRNVGVRRETISTPSKVMEGWEFEGDPLYEAAKSLDEELEDDKSSALLKMEKEDGEVIIERVENPSQDQRIESYKKAVIGIAGAIANYQGSFSFSEEEFERVFERYENVKKWQPRTQKYICPLANFSTEQDRIDFPIEFTFVNSPHKVEINELKITRMTPKDWAGVFTYENGENLRGFADAERSTVSHKLELEIEGGAKGVLSRQVIKSLCRGLRLFKPKATSVYGGPTYKLESAYLEKRKNVPDITGCGPSELNPETGYMTETFEFGEQGEYTIADEEVEEFKEFWNKYSDFLNGERDTKISSPLRRFDEMYSDIYPEDRLVDCAIGFEGTLLRGLGKQSSYTFRMKLRSGFLLENRLPLTKDEIWKFFKNFYFVRGEIVHKDKKIDDIINHGRFKNQDGLSPREFVKRARVVYAKTLLAYMDRLDDGQPSITEINKELDNRALNAE
ncbi:hypothetical protein [Halorussus litoreus]|uniref:hypothetical protein n=1 Tax=Halorussus litoreus TaxID=1710536 RepID=UPI0013009FFF|nr:hypothetical protein [Halorussus litoreus]